MTITTPHDINTIKTRIKATWMDGDYGTFATYMELGRNFVKLADCIWQ